MRRGLFKVTRIHSDQQISLLTGFLLKCLSITFMNVSRLELEVGIKHGRSDGVSVWIFCVGASVRLDGCSGVGLGV